MCYFEELYFTIFHFVLFFFLSDIVNFPKTLPDRTYSLPGDIAVIDCQRPESIPPAQMQYFFNGTPIVENGKFNVANL